jgi:hypothetical protein
LKVGQILVSLDGQPIRVVDDAQSIVAQNVGRPIPAIVIDTTHEKTVFITPNDGTNWGGSLSP